MAKLPPGSGDGKTMEQMWKEFGRWIRANDVKGNPKQQGNVAASRKSKLQGQYGGGEGPKGSGKAKPKPPRSVSGK